MQVTVYTEKKIYNIPIEKDTSLSEILASAKLQVPHPCGGNGICGKCKVRAAGQLSPMSSEEEKLLTEAEREKGIRLACRTSAHGDAQIWLTEDAQETMQGLTEGQMPLFEKKPLSGDKDCYAMALDIGTTTVAGYLYKMPECICVGTDCRVNPQTAYGADVISRIQYANDGGLMRLKLAVQSVISDIVKGFGHPIEQYVITGNTTMLHFLTGLDPSGIAVAPFTPQSLFGEWIGRAYLPPCISAYVGADITTAILASGLRRHQNALLVDIGTNGEMAFQCGEKLTCCSTAAGPAFEGAGISKGMPAIAGAIDHVSVQDGVLVWQTIGKQPPVGICGSGLMDAIACLLATGQIDETGYAEDDLPIGDSGVVLTAADIRQVQLAKAAIRAGIETLTKNAPELEQLYIAGGFGSYVDIESCIRIGLLPPSVRGKVTVLGNAAGSGAAMILQSSDQLIEAEQIAKQAETVELSSSPVFMEQYMEQMMFPAEG